MSALRTLRGIVAEAGAGRRRGLPSWCTAHGPTLAAILAAHRGDDGPILVEATCNQVNHRGGYTGLAPADFQAFVLGLADRAGVDRARLILGGDHLGPNPWKSLPAAQAMDEARRMVDAYVRAGFGKIHLDASMACADDGDLPEETIAERAADLCAVAEAAAQGAEKPLYVVGTEVPIPGGELSALDALAVTPPEAARRARELHRDAFARRGLGAATERTIGLVVQPGVDMGNDQVFAFDPAKAAALAAGADLPPGLAFEAHSTDFQTEAALSALVASRFAVLKVGPALTFAYREATFAMAQIAATLGIEPRPGVVAALEAAMDADPSHWRPYVADGDGTRVARLYGLSDRVRYYWAAPPVARACADLEAAIDGATIP
ncbi:MAG: class II D-tagatose-bisphosphate aldolase, non-catalytic subunit, partial [Hyphomicrobiales bacterium]|nr:class II D-tagatose-bisphosphate aldolase, non-catalytic subunit [Hyphomicrobiales bacterium]